MARNANINVHHMTRVEGHGDIVVEIREGKLERIRFAVVEAPRFFEAFLRGQGFDEVTHTASRICGICAVSHKCAALKATEAALGVEVSDQTQLLRRLAFHGEIISSHILHIYFLAAPDFLGIPSAFPLIESNRELVLQAMRLKKLGYDLSAMVGGRHTHPVAMQVGGFSFVHAEDALTAMKDRLLRAIEDIKETVRFFKSIELPKLEQETDYVSLKHPDHYAFYDGDIFSSKDETVPVIRYRDVIEEHVVPYSTAKHASWKGSRYMVGALARFNNNSNRLMPLAKEAARDLGLDVPCFNPFMNTIAQIVECAHCVEDGIEIIEQILSSGIKADAERAQVKVRSGVGVGAVEAPRGILFHEYEYDQAGKCLTANHVIPTAQNLANLEADMRVFAPRFIDAEEKEIAYQLEMLARAYDPCISCSTHVVRL
ncbi:MAG: Ni/Fe hydrogenase subunit alpha [Desulfoferrobacter sp.]